MLSSYRNSYLLLKSTWRSRQEHQIRMTTSWCRLWGKSPESLADVLTSCSSLAQTKHLETHIAAPKVLFFQMLRQLKPVDTVPPWFTCADPKPLSKLPKAEAYWDVSVFPDHTFVQANRVDDRPVDHNIKKLLMVEMSCPWVNNRAKKDTEKTGVTKTIPRV